MTSKLVQRLSSLDKWDISICLLSGFSLGAAIMLSFLAYQGYRCTLSPTFQCKELVKEGTTEVSRPVVHVLPEITIEGSRKPN